MVKRSTSAPSPLSPTRWPPDAFLWWRSLLFALAWAAVYFVTAIVVAIFTVARFGRFTMATIPATVVVGSEFAVYVPLAVLLVYGLPRLARRSLRQLGLRARPIHVLWGIGGAAAMFVVASVVGAIEESVLHLHVQETAVNILRGAHGGAAFAFGVMAVVAAPFIEEMTFRGFVFNALLRYLPPVSAGALAAILFGLAHYDKTSPSAVLPLAAGGAVLCYVYYRTGSLIATMIAHGTFNLITVVGVTVFHQA